MLTSLRQIVGVFLLDGPRYVKALFGRDQAWIVLRNRGDRITFSRERRGVRCDWHGSSDLHAARVLPIFGRWLLQRAIWDCPIKLSLEAVSVSTEAPDVSFVIGHAGAERLPLLILTIASIAAQEGARIECIVVEQAPKPEALAALPAWVRHVHLPSASGAPYNRSLAFNRGAELSRGKLVVLHDGDILVPTAYARELRLRGDAGYELIDLKRFVFYLTQAHAAGLAGERTVTMDLAPETVVQNLRGGATVCISREAFERIGGFDERFVGWGGEDMEFWERARTVTTWDFGFLPFVHLWHAPQPGKTSQKNTPAMELYQRLTTVPPSQRIEALRARRAADACR